MNIRKNSAKNVVYQIVIFLVVMAGLILYFKQDIANFYVHSGISQTGTLINLSIVILFLLGMVRILMTLFRYINEHHAVIKMVEYLKNNKQDITSIIHDNHLITQRYKAVQWVAKQGAPVNQNALASATNSAENTRLTVIRFVHSTLILAGVFGTVVSLSIALIGAAGLLSSPEGVREMSTIVGGMSSALSSTITAIMCFFVFAYFYLRLNDSRIQLLTSIEEVTTLYMLPRVTYSEESVVRKVAELTDSLNVAADRMLMVEKRFMHAGETLQNAVNDLHGQISSSSLNEIKDLIRKGFHLSEPEYTALEEDKTGHQNIHEFQSKDDYRGNIDLTTDNSKVR